MLHPHLKELSLRHRDLDRKISEETSRPLADQIKISELKRQKLRLKERMVNIEERSQS